jgi:predicted dehydrogenase
MKTLDRAITDLVTIGCGDVVQSRVLPALRELRDVYGINHFAMFDVKPCPFAPGALDPKCESFHQIPDGVSASEAVRRAGLLNPRTAVLVCTPTPLHVPLAREFAPSVGLVGVEKPTCHDPAAARGLIDFAGTVFPLGHQLHKRDQLDFVAACRHGRVTLADIARLDFTLFEDKGVGARQVDEAIWDTGWHGFECALAPLLALAERVQVRVQRARVATYRGGPDLPRAATAARIDALLLTPGKTVPLTVRVAKGADTSAKGLTAYDATGRAVHHVSLNEGGHHAHGRMIAELLRPVPDMPLSLTDVVGVVEACATAARRAEVMTAYPYGAIPYWLTAGTAEEAPPPAAHEPADAELVGAAD